MARKREFGQLLWRPAKGTWHARVRLFDPKVGKKRRQMIDLETASQAEARDHLAALQADDAAVPKRGRWMTFREATDAAHTEWTQRKLVSADERKRTLEIWAYPLLADRRVDKIGPADIRAVLQRALEAGRRQNTIANLKNSLGSVFGQLWRDGKIAENPVAKVRTIKVREVTKQRAVLTDDEFEVLLAWEHPEKRHRVALVELQTMAAISRMFGGLRYGDLLSLRWENLGAPGFEEGWSPRKKTCKPQLLKVPEQCRPFIAAWWDRWGRPAKSWVFPCIKGRGAGKRRRSPHNSAASGLRRALKRALGVETYTPRGRSGKRWTEIPRSEWSQRWIELFTETDYTLPVDFHSFRRAYATALAASGLNAQAAMRLAGHSSVDVHMRYVAKGATALAAPSEAMPAGQRAGQRSGLSEDRKYPMCRRPLEPPSRLELETCCLRIDSRKRHHESLRGSSADRCEGLMHHDSRRSVVMLPSAAHRARIRAEIATALEQDDDALVAQLALQLEEKAC